MPDSHGMLSASEAAVVSAVAVRAVNRAIDEHILPDTLISRGSRERRVSADACMFIAFYNETAHQLTSDERKRLIITGTRFLKDGKSPTIGPDWVLWDGFVGINLAPFAEAAAKRFKRLEQARDSVTTTPDVLAGTAVFKGTRIPVHDVAASVIAGISRERRLAAYPSLTEDQMDLAVLYAEAYPLQGRPRASQNAVVGAIVVEDRRVARRTATARG